MTLVAITFQDSEFICCADTRISGPKANAKGFVPLVDTFGKIFVIPGRCDVGSPSEAHQPIRFEIGAAFAGGTLISSTIISLATNILSNLHSSTKLNPPSFVELVEAVRRVSECVFEEMKWKRADPDFVFLIFGFCPLSGQEKLFQVSLDFSSPPATVIASQLEISDGAILAVGSGREALQEIAGEVASADGLQVGLPSLVYRVLAAGLDKATGGGMTIARANQSGIRLIPVALPQSASDLETEIDISISGLDIAKIGDVGEYSVAGAFIGAGIEMAQNNQWLVRIGFDLEKTEVTPSHRNLASLQYNLDYPPSDGTAIDLKGKDFTVYKPNFTSEKRYYSCSCSECHLITPLIEVRQDARSERLFRNGQISCICMHCNSLSRVSAESVFLK